MSGGYKARTAWPAVGEDPMTGLPNLLALIGDFQGPSNMTRLAIAGFDVRGLGTINKEFGRAEGDRILLEVADSLVKSTAALKLAGSRVYRLGGDEFCVVLPGLADAEPLLDDLRLTGTLSRVRYVSVTCLAKGKNLEEVFLEVWPLLMDSLQAQAGVRGGQVKRVTRLLVERVRETVELLRVSRQLAYTDDISGLPNHRAAMHLIREHLSRRASARDPLGLLFADGDNLRVYNEHLGYAGGNEMIRKLGNVIAAETLPGELVARWLSGDEFMIMLPGCGKAEAMKRATAIRQAVEAQSTCWIYPVTISIGVASAPEDGTELEALVSKLEEANARAKKQGKNRVCGV